MKGEALEADLLEWSEQDEDVREVDRLKSQELLHWSVKVEVIVLWQPGQHVVERHCGKCRTWLTKEKKKSTKMSVKEN